MTTYSAEFVHIRNIVTKYTPVLMQDKNFNKILTNELKIVSRKAPTLQTMLSPSMTVSNKPRKSSWLSRKGFLDVGKIDALVVNSLNKRKYLPV